MSEETEAHQCEAGGARRSSWLVFPFFLFFFAAFELGPNHGLSSAPCTLVQARSGRPLCWQDAPVWKYHLSLQAPVRFMPPLGGGALGPSLVGSRGSLKHSACRDSPLPTALVLRASFPPHSPARTPSPPSVKRHWLPNVQRKSLYSESLGKSISLKVTTYALREMDRMGACFFFAHVFACVTPRLYTHFTLRRLGPRRAIGKQRPPPHALMPRCPLSLPQAAWIITSLARPRPSWTLSRARACAAK